MLSVAGRADHDPIGRELLIRTVQAALVTTAARDIRIYTGTVQIPLPNNEIRSPITKHVIYAIMAVPHVRMTVANAQMERPTFDASDPDDDRYYRVASIRRQINN